ncbi:MAG: hypothetical protein Kow0090_20690 [Myxococcota bacterium]
MIFFNLMLTKLAKGCGTLIMKKILGLTSISLFFVASALLSSCERGGENAPPSPQPAAESRNSPLPNAETESGKALETTAQLLPLSTAKPLKLREIEGLSPAERAEIQTFSIQVAAYSDGEIALKAANNLIRNNLPTIVTEADLGAKGVWYRLRTGVFRNREIAEIYLSELLKMPQLPSLVPHEGEFTPFVIENEGVSQEFERLHTIFSSVKDLPPAKLYPTMDVWGKGLPALFASREEKSVGAVRLDNMNNIHFISSPIAWKECRECRDIPLDKSGVITNIEPIGIMNRLNTPFGAELWVSVEVDGAHKVVQAYNFRRGGEGAESFEPVFEMPVREWPSTGPGIKRIVAFEDIDGDDVKEALISERSHLIWERQLCMVWGREYAHFFDGRRYSPVLLENFEEFEPKKGDDEQAKKLVSLLLSKRQCESAAAVFLKRAGAKEKSEGVVAELREFSGELKKNHCDMVAIRFLLLGGELFDSVGESGKGLYESALDELSRAVKNARILHKPSCDESPLARNFLPTEKDDAVIAKYLDITFGMIAPELFTGGDIARLAKAFKLGGERRKELKDAWLDILRLESANMYKLMRISLEIGDDK